MIDSVYAIGFLAWPIGSVILLVFLLGQLVLLFYWCLVWLIGSVTLLVFLFGQLVL